MNAKSIKPTTLFLYGFIAFPLAFAGFPLYIIAPDFYATTYYVSLSSLGTSLLALRLFDAIQDPIIGYLCDRYRNLIRLMMSVSAVVLAISIFCLFNVDYFSPLFRFSLFIGIAVTGYSLLSISLNTIGALWSSKPLDQTLISAVREGLGLLGLIVAVSLPSLLSTVVTTTHIYVWFGIILFVFTFLGIFLFLKGYPYQIENNEQKAVNSISHSFIPNRSIIKRSLPFFLAYFMSMFASSIPAVLVIFFIRDHLHAEAYSGLFLILYFLSGALFIPLWKKWASTVGTYHAWATAMSLACLSFIWAFFLNSGDLIQYAVICICSGSALGADLLLPPAILADQIHESKSENQASNLFAWLGLSSKLALAFASGVALPLVGFFGFVPASTNSSSALLGLRITYALIPCILKAICAVVLFKDRTSH